MNSVPTTRQRRSDCPINLAVEVLGDRWSLIVLRDIMFFGRRRYRELLAQSREGIASNILADRLKRLLAEGLLTRAAETGHRQKAVYSLTEKAIALLPVLVQIGAWGRHWLEPAGRPAALAGWLEDGGPALWARLEDALRAEHLGSPRQHDGPSVAEELRAALGARDR